MHNTPSKEEITQEMELHNADEVGIDNQWTFDDAEYHLLLSDKYHQPSLEPEKIHRILHEYAVDNIGEDDLRGIIKVFAEIIEMSYEELIAELQWINEFEKN